MNSLTHPTITVNQPGSPLPWLLLIAAALIAAAIVIRFLIRRAADGISECPSDGESL